MNGMKHILWAFICCTILEGHVATSLADATPHSCPKDVAIALSLAGTNRHSLEQVLEHYKPNTLEYRATCFLIAHMPCHSIGGHILHLDAKTDSLVHTADLDYHHLIDGHSEEEQESDPLHAQIESAAKAASAAHGQWTWSQPIVREHEATDIEALDGSFIRKQVDHCCQMRRSSPVLMQMPEKDFFEYILPYRSISNYPLVTTTDTLNRIYSKYLQADTAANAIAVTQRYNRATWWLRHWGGAYPFDSSIGWREMFFSRDFHDCIDMAFYAAQIYRACGWPAAVEYNTAYKIWSGQHYDLAVPEKRSGTWQSFSPETELPRPAGERFKQCLNIYRMHFSRQDNTPAMLHASGEPIPEELADPCIEDVSANYTTVCQLSLPLPSTFPKGHKLAYLASFQAHKGWEPVTWGLADIRKGIVTFPHVVTDNIYIPIALDGQGNQIPIGNSFQLKRTKQQGIALDTHAEAYQALALSSSTSAQIKVEIARKFPRKPSLLACAQKAVGTLILGADTEDFRHADTLGIIAAAPRDEWTDLKLKPHQPYRFYRVCAPKENPHVMLSEIQFLASSIHPYKNVTTPTALDGTNTADSTWIRILDEPLEKCGWKAEYDGNVQTAPDQWPDVTLKLQESQQVECLRFMVKNADNHVKAGDWYVLHHWTGKGWEEIWQGKPRTNHLPALVLQIGHMYWLEDLSHGSEELPFIVQKDGNISFPHYWLLNN